jgi:hypothetical protein
MEPLQIVKRLEDIEADLEARQTDFERRPATATGSPATTNCALPG